jgi:hypothetical protein
MIRIVHPGSRIRMLTFYPSRIPDPGVKKAPDLGSRIRNTACYRYQIQIPIPDLCSLFYMCKIHKRDLFFTVDYLYNMEAKRLIGDGWLGRLVARTAATKAI